jgi:hypothetical protein
MSAKYCFFSVKPKDKTRQSYQKKTELILIKKETFLERKKLYISFFGKKTENAKCMKFQQKIFFLECGNFFSTRTNYKTSSSSSQGGATQLRPQFPQSDKNFHFQTNFFLRLTFSILPRT